MLGKDGHRKAAENGNSVLLQAGIKQEVHLSAISILPTLIAG